MDRYEKLEEEKFKQVYKKIAKETKVEIEISISKNMDLTFLISGNRVNVDQAKCRIIATFQNQVNYF